MEKMEETCKSPKRIKQILVGRIIPNWMESHKIPLFQTTNQNRNVFPAPHIYHIQVSPHRDRCAAPISFSCWEPWSKRTALQALVSPVPGWEILRPMNTMEPGWNMWGVFTGHGWSIDFVKWIWSMDYTWLYMVNAWFSMKDTHPESFKRSLWQLGHHSVSPSARFQRLHFPDFPWQRKSYGLLFCEGFRRILYIYTYIYIIYIIYTYNMMRWMSHSKWCPIFSCRSWKWLLPPQKDLDL